MPSATALTIALFGLSCLVAGIHTLTSPSTYIGNLSLPLQALPAVYGLGLASTAMGIYYLLAAYQENRAFFVATVPMRLLTTAVFAGLGGPWRVPAIWEGIGALITLVALVWERSRERVKMV
ncbi:hypothetical protein EG328_012015 [Venturia inaequalis]|uniref:Uncharacterized protein n=1 Tax=Venturia inaequalis TaxID=5025 RepID=A0A8H3U3M4_VENIN|nr:hypothetical protein EG328_012015 [Venturia inaequalis]KAE9962981.1 hypothetical protein EG327_001738 [Venturia inaequalis]RDI85422.1 hypothetical protein Vi05172_g4815 [Venturia inaequalis]